MKKTISILMTAGLLFFAAVQTVADDTEIYQSQFNSANIRPKVLLLFDNSGSMDNNVTNQKPAYVSDPDNPYATQAGIVSGRIYWSTDGAVPPQDTTQWFNDSKNRCEESDAPMDAVGFFQGKSRRWRTDVLRWDTLVAGMSDPEHVDCSADVVNSNELNDGHTAGYPATATDSPYVSAQADSDVDWSGTGYTFFTANYMNWYYGTSANTTRTRINIAKETVKNLIWANPGIDFGLGVFNTNEDSNDDGGRIVHRVIEDMTTADRANLVNMVEGLVDDTWTPLCETMWEAYRYLSGDAPTYKDEWDQGSQLSASTGYPAPDADAIDTDSTYKSPLGECQYTYIIYMTDGQPTRDTDANAKVEALPGIDNCGSGDGDCLPELAEYMYTHDMDGDATNGIQKVITYTIAFTLTHALMEDTATSGGGKYYRADSATELAKAFQGAVAEILSTNTTFTAPAVATNSFNRTQSLDSVYMAMFEPNDGQRWAGNVKKFKINASGQLVDKNGNVAIDTATGNILDTAVTFWGATADGGEVKKGGAGAKLAAISDLSTRKIWSNIDTTTSFSATNFENALTGARKEFADTAALYNHFGVADATEFSKLLEWARGVDVDDEDDDGSTSDNRPWILGDILHSQPLAINYGALGSHTTSDPDVRLVFGTNEGFIHMIDADDGTEDWAFFPWELGSILAQKRADVTTADHLYGLDGKPVIWTQDANGDGTIDSSAGDKAYLVIGMRRGGRAYYAINVSDPDSPTFLWRIDDETTGFSELGQTWSTPTVTTIPGHTGPVIVFGGGYDVNKDAPGVGSADSMGRALYIADLVTGDLIWSISPAANSSTNMKEADLKHSVPADVAVLDSNGDKVTDRIYFGDTGGNLWRVDLPGATRPTSSQDTWFITQLAQLGLKDNNTDRVATNIADDRRFFNRPDIVRTRTDSGSYDGVLIGSGDRTSPNDTNVTNNRFYVIRDKRLVPYTTSAPASGTCGTDIDFRLCLPLEESNLYNATANYIQDGTAAEQTTAATDLFNSSKHGFFITLEHTGEKSLSRSISLSGQTFFTTFTPESSTLNVCEPQPGTGRLYHIDMHDGRAVVDYSGNSTLEKADRIIELGNQIPPAPTIHVDPDTGKVRLIFPFGSGQKIGGLGGTLDSGTELEKGKGVYWYQEEY